MLLRVKRAGYVAIGAAAVLWAVGGAYASRLIDQGASVVELTEARSWIAAVGIGLIAFARRRSAAPPPGRAPAWLVVPFALSITGSNFLYYASLSRIPVAVAITVQYTAPGLVVLAAAIAGRSRPTARVLWALGLAFAGVALLAELPGVLGDAGVRIDGLGFAAALASAFTFATYMLVGERLGRAFTPEAGLFRAFLLSSALWIVVQAFRGRPETLLQARFVPGVLFLAIATTIAPFLLFVWGLRTVPAPRAGIVSTLEPLAAALIAYLWLGQSLTATQVAGGLMVVAGIGVVRSERPPPPDVLAEQAAGG